MTESKTPTVVRTVRELRTIVSQWRTSGQRIALVPTMGALHDGHLSLVDMAQTMSDRIIVSIFVNPTQFGPNEDFDHYPRDENQDLAKLSSTATDILFAPSRSEMYGSGFATNIHVANVSEGLCGAVRPGHFDGVATIVSKLLLQATPDVAVFGEKDYQQLLVIKRLVEDLDIPTRILGAPIIREADGLAMSSRNRYLTVPQRQIAVQLSKTLHDLIANLSAGVSAKEATERARANLLKVGFESVDYVEIRDADSLQPWTGDLQNGRVLAAAHLGSTRLIDNMPTETPA